MWLRFARRSFGIFMLALVVGRYRYGNKRGSTLVLWWLVQYNESKTYQHSNEWCTNATSMTTTKLRTNAITISNLTIQRYFNNNLHKRYLSTTTTSELSFTTSTNYQSTICQQGHVVIASESGCIKKFSA